jgi:Fumarate reductase subunit D
VAFPLGWFSPPTHEHLLTIVNNPLTRLVLFLPCSLSRFHWAHRFRYTMYDGGGAVLGVLVAAYRLWRVASRNQEGTTMKAYVLIDVRAGKTRQVVGKLRQTNGVRDAHACWVAAYYAAVGLDFDELIAA